MTFSQQASPPSDPGRTAVEGPARLPAEWKASTVRVGVDATSVAQVRDSVARFGVRYLHRVFTPHELESCGGPDGVPAPERLAARFAAKEATLKVLRVAGAQPPWTEMEVRRHPTGWCEMVLTGSAQQLALGEGIVQPLSLSLTHEGDLAMAVVVTFGEAALSDATASS